MTRMEGGCLCGAVRYRLDEKPTSVEFCHCSMCRRAAGAPVVAWMDVLRSTLTWVRGTPTYYESSPGMRRGFCSNCGGSLTFDNTTNKEKITLTVATLDDPAPIAPTFHIYAADQLPWLNLADDLPRHPRG